MNMSSLLFKCPHCEEKNNIDIRSTGLYKCEKGETFFCNECGKEFYLWCETTPEQVRITCTCKIADYNDEEDE
jgi:transcription elongation factor Elf1